MLPAKTRAAKVQNKLLRTRPAVHQTIPGGAHLSSFSHLHIQFPLRHSFRFLAVLVKSQLETGRLNGDGGGSSEQTPRNVIS